MNRSGTDPIAMWPDGEIKTMASMYPPPDISIVDPGTAPEIYVDGMALYSEIGGVIRAAFYTDQPMAGEEGGVTRTIVLRLVYTPGAQALMRAQILERLVAAPRNTALQGVPS